LKRCKVATKTRRADLFSEGWVLSVVDTIAAFCGTEQQTSAIDVYLATHYPSRSDLNTRNRNDSHNLRDHEYQDYAAGHLAGKDARLSRGVGGAGQRLALE
jgi:hypothetical protein